MRGRFITLEGGEGAGKSTQVALLADGLRAAGQTVVTTREPGGTPGAEAIRTLLVQGAADRWQPLTEALLVNAARADHVARLIRPALEAGKWVLCDRYVDSTFAYQGGQDVSDADLTALHRIATGDLWPDLTLWFDLPVEQGLERAAARQPGTARFEAQPLDYHQRLAGRFADRAAAEPARWRRIDATQSLDAVSAAVWAVVSPLLGSD